MEIAVFGGGCFWCTEAIFNRLKGVVSVEPGYSGGEVENPTYEVVSMGNTNHAEVIKIEFNLKLISFELLLEIFFNTHNPTTLNRQGNDIGTQYRSVIFYTGVEQKEKARLFIDKLEQEKKFDNKIVTKLENFTKFYPAEEYHKNYYERNKNNLYCDATIKPKIDKIVSKYNNFLRDEFR